MNYRLTLVLLVSFLGFCYGQVQFYQLINTGTDTPMPRDNFGMVPDPHSNICAYLFGGNFANITGQNLTFYNDFWKFCLYSQGSTKFTWDLVHTSVDTPSARSFHCMNVLTYQNTAPVILIFGGSTFSAINGSNTPVRDMFYAFRPDTGVVLNLTSSAVSGGISPRTGCACASFNSELYIFGGVNSSGSVLSEMWFYDWSNGIFTQKTSMPDTGVWLANTNFLYVWQNIWMYIQGGVTKYPIINDFVLNLTQSDISEKLWVYDRRFDNWTEEAVVDNIFPKRIQGAMTATITNQLYMFGGNVLNNTHLNISISPINPPEFNLNYTNCPSSWLGFTVGQLWTYNLQTRIWTNHTVTPLLQAGDPQLIPPIANGKIVFIGAMPHIFGGTIMQCPFVNAIPNINVTRMALGKFKTSN